MSSTTRLSVLILLTASLARPAAADSVTLGAASAYTGVEVCRGGFPFPQCTARPFDTSQDLAWAGNGYAQSAVAKTTIAGYPAIHLAEYANDGLYGNGASWIADGANSWLKIDLGREVAIDRLTFGRDRLGYHDDRDPGQFLVYFALDDDVYANGNDVNDTLEYTLVLDSSLYGFSGVIAGPATVQAAFSAAPVARFVKLQFDSALTAIDEVEVFGSAVPEPATVLLLGAGLAGLAVRRRRRAKLRHRRRADPARGLRRASPPQFRRSRFRRMANTPNAPMPSSHVVEGWGPGSSVNAQAPRASALRPSVADDRVARPAVSRVVLADAGCDFLVRCYPRALRCPLKIQNILRAENRLSHSVFANRESRIP